MVGIPATGLDVLDVGQQRRGYHIKPETESIYRDQGVEQWTAEQDLSETGSGTAHSNYEASGRRWRWRVLGG